MRNRTRLVSSTAFSLLLALLTVSCTGDLQSGETKSPVASSPEANSPEASSPYAGSPDANGLDANSYANGVDAGPALSPAEQEADAQAIARSVAKNVVTTSPNVITTTPDQTTDAKAIVNAVAKARRSCQAACDSENGECNSDVRRSRQECSKQAATGGINPFTGRPDAFDYYCGYFEIADCQSRLCVERFSRRYAECVQFMRGDVTSRRFDCIRAEGRAQNLCRLELRDCRSQCDE